jgi:hypothetical protein
MSAQQIIEFCWPKYYLSNTTENNSGKVIWGQNLKDPNGILKRLLKSEE